MTSHLEFFLSFFSGSTSRIHVTIWMPTKNEKKPKIHEIPIFSSERAVSRIHLFVEKTSLNNFLTPSLFGGSKLLLCSILLLICKQNLSKSSNFLSAQIKWFVHGKKSSTTKSFFHVLEWKKILYWNFWQNISALGFFNLWTLGMLTSQICNAKLGLHLLNF